MSKSSNLFNFLFQVIMGCGTSRSQESPRSSPSTPPPHVTSIKNAEETDPTLIIDKNPVDEIELKLFEPESSKGLNSFKALAFAHTKFVQQVRTYYANFQF
jgi:hypothetical protein